MTLRSRRVAKIIRRNLPYCRLHLIDNKKQNCVCNYECKYGRSNGTMYIVKYPVELGTAVKSAYNKNESSVCCTLNTMFTIYLAEYISSSTTKQLLQLISSYLGIEKIKNKQIYLVHKQKEVPDCN